MNWPLPRTIFNDPDDLKKTVQFLLHNKLPERRNTRTSLSIVHIIHYHSIHVSYSYSFAIQDIQNWIALLRMLGRFFWNFFLLLYNLLFNMNFSENQYPYATSKLIRPISLHRNLIVPFVDFTRQRDYKQKTKIMRSFDEINDNTRHLCIWTECS